MTCRAWVAGPKIVSCLEGQIVGRSGVRKESHWSNKNKRQTKKKKKEKKEKEEEERRRRRRRSGKQQEITSGALCETGSWPLLRAEWIFCLAHREFIPRSRSLTSDVWMLILNFNWVNRYGSNGNCSLCSQVNRAIYTSYNGTGDKYTTQFSVQTKLQFHSCASKMVFQIEIHDKSNALSTAIARSLVQLLSLISHEQTRMKRDQVSLRRQQGIYWCISHFAFFLAQTTDLIKLIYQWKHQQYTSTRVFSLWWHLCQWRDERWEMRAESGSELRTFCQVQQLLSIENAIDSQWVSQVTYSHFLLASIRPFSHKLLREVVHSNHLPRHSLIHCAGKPLTSSRAEKRFLE